MNGSADKYPFYVNATRYESERSALTGAELKDKAHVPLADELYLEEHGGADDKVVTNDELVKLDAQVRHFYSDAAHKRPTHYIFSLDATWYETQHPARTGAQIKEIGRVELTYQLFLEAEGDQPDRKIPDQETVPLHGAPKHFYAAPPATFGTP